MARRTFTFAGIAVAASICVEVATTDVVPAAIASDIHPSTFSIGTRMRHDIGKLASTDVSLFKTPPLIVLFALFLVLGAVSVFADGGPAPIRAFRAFTRGSGATGLPASTVVALHTDREGTIWIATYDGVARVENGGVERLRSSTDAPVAGPMFRIIDRRDGGIFVAGAKGVYAFDGSAWTLLPSPEELIALAEDTSKNIIALDKRIHPREGA